MFHLDQIINSSEKLKAEIEKPPQGAQVVSDEHGVSITGSSVLPLNYLSPKSILEITGLLVDAVNKETSKRHKDDRSGWAFCDWIAGSHGGSSVIKNAKGNSKYTFSNFIKVSMLICPDSKYKFMLNHFEIIDYHNQFVSSVVSEKGKQSKKNTARAKSGGKEKAKKEFKHACKALRSAFKSYLDEGEFIGNTGRKLGKPSADNFYLKVRSTEKFFDPETTDEHTDGNCIFGVKMVRKVYKKLMEKRVRKENKK